MKEKEEELLIKWEIENLKRMDKEEALKRISKLNEVQKSNV